MRQSAFVVATPRADMRGIYCVLFGGEIQLTMHPHFANIFANKHAVQIATHTQKNTACLILPFAQVFHAHVEFQLIFLHNRLAVIVAAPVAGVLSHVNTVHRITRLNINLPSQFV